MMSFRILVLCVLVVSTCASSHAHDDDCSHGTVLASVLERTGAPVAGLTPADFRGKLHGKSIQIHSVVKENLPHRIVVLLDASDSMIGLNDRIGKWTLALRVSKTLVDLASDKEMVSLVLFSDKLEGTVSFEESRDSIRNRLQVLAPGKSVFPNGTRHTAIWDSILAALSASEKLEFGDEIYLITNADDTASRAEHSLVQTELYRKHIRLSGFFFNEPEDPRMRVSEQSPLADFIKLAKDTGGVAISLSPLNFFGQSAYRSYRLPRSDMEELERTIQGQHQLFANSYRLDIGFQEKPGKPRHLVLEFADQEKDPWRQRILVYPHVVRACSAPLHGN
jgi:hypothetical protein